VPLSAWPSQIAIPHDYVLGVSPETDATSVGGLE